MWRNFGRNQSCVPAEWERPESEDELVEIVKRAGESGRTVKPVGSGHSYSSIACTDGHLVDLASYGRVLAADTVTGLVTVEAGIPLHTLNEELATRHLALENLGDIDRQSIAGATATGTHGTGREFRSISSTIVAMRLITADGSIVSCSADEQPDVWSAARVGLGALGVVSTLTIRAVPAFNVHVVHEVMRVDDVLAELDASIDENDHFGFLWFPGSRGALVKRGRRTTEPARPRHRISAFVDDVVVDNYVFGASCRLAGRFPTVGRTLVRAASGKSRQEWTDRSDRAFTFPWVVPLAEMEYAIPREAFREAFVRVGRLIDDLGVPVSVPVECRWSAADDIPLSHAQGRDTAYIAVHVHRSQPYDQYFQGVETIMNDYGGRPHWGKLHFQTAETLAPRYPEWDAFMAIRNRLDPVGRFRNPYLDRVLGPPHEARR